MGNLIPIISGAKSLHKLFGATKQIVFVTSLRVLSNNEEDYV